MIYATREETWIRLAKALSHIVAGELRIEIDREKKCARGYRIAYMTGKTKRGPLPYSPYEGKEEIFICGEGAIVKLLGTGYFDLMRDVKKAIFKATKIREPLVKELSEEKIRGTAYFWSLDQSATNLLSRYEELLFI